MEKPTRHRFPKNVRSSAKEDLVQFAIPGIIVLIVEVNLLGQDGLGDIWWTLGQMIVHPSVLAEVPAHAVAGMFLFLFGLTIMCWGQVTLFKNYSGTVVIHEGHELVTRGIYRLVRNPMYLGLFVVLIVGLPLYVSSLRAFLVSLFLIPIVLNRIRLEEKLLTEHFGELYLEYKRTTKRIIPGVF
ncbi:MAG: isoprenylcysteine carboxylmethyltransferase family protein [bacterium]|nr:isoprenylcysteine carboxylmethyltransferase family protein [bacterium]